MTSSYLELKAYAVHVVQKALHRSPKAVALFTEFCDQHDNPLIALYAFCVVDHQLPYLEALLVSRPASAYADQLVDHPQRDMIMSLVDRVLEIYLIDVRALSADGFTPSGTPPRPTTNYLN